MINLKIECDSIGEIDTKYYQHHLRVELVNINEQQFIGEILDNISIENLLSQIDTESLQNEIKRRLEDED